MVENVFNNMYSYQPHMLIPGKNFNLVICLDFDDVKATTTTTTERHSFNQTSGLY